MKNSMRFRHLVNGVRILFFNFRFFLEKFLCPVLSVLIMQRIGELINSGKSPKSPLSPASDKSRKYDRQLRIWGDHGQYLIEVCSVCLVNADSTGTEILKNLVLAGIGSFTIIDGNKVSKEDDNNFFFDTSSVGKNRAFIACSNLRELNPDVSGDYIEENADILLDADHTLFTKFSVVIVSNLYNEKTLCKLSELLYNLNIPLVLAYSLGFFGLIRLQTYEHPIIESHPDNILEDLRLDRPFKGIISPIKLLLFIHFYFHRSSRLSQLISKLLIHLTIISFSSSVYSNFV